MEINLKAKRRRMNTGRSTKSKSGGRECNLSACPYHQSSCTRLNSSSGVPDRIIHELVQTATKRIAFGEEFKEHHEKCIKKYIRLLQRKGIIKLPVKLAPTNKLLEIEKRVRKSKAIRKV